LAGQAELSDKLDSTGLEQLAQRVQLRFHIKPLAEAEIRDYIEHRLATAGADKRNIFPKDTIPLIHRYTGGVPRLINILCDTTLTAAFVENIPLVSTKLVNMAVQELQWPPYGERLGKSQESKSREARDELSPLQLHQEPENGLPHSNGLEEKLNRLYDFVPKFATSVTNRMKHLDEQLKGLAALIRERK
jgi:general secretion pathway protein A